MKNKKALPAPASTTQSVSVRLEKISNGYLIRTSTSDDKGWKEKTEYSKTKPILNIPSTAPKKVKK